MQVEVNGKPRQLEDGMSLGQLVSRSVQRADGVAVAVNRAVVPRSRWDLHLLHAGDRIEIIQAVGGG